MYNRYQGNTGRVERVEDSPPYSPPEPKTPPPPPPPQPPPPRAPEPPPKPGLWNTILQKLNPAALETEDLILLLLFWLLYRESGDEEFLFLLIGILLF